MKVITKLISLNLNNKNVTKYKNYVLNFFFEVKSYKFIIMVTHVKFVFLLIFISF